MNARSLNPVLDYAAEMEARENAAESNRWFLSFDDLLEDGPISVDGTLFDATVEVSFVRHGERGSIEINSLEIKNNNLYLHLPGHNDLVKLDLAHYEQNHRLNFNRLENALELKALTRAKLSDKWESEHE